MIQPQFELVKQSRKYLNSFVFKNTENWSSFQYFRGTQDVVLQIMKKENIQIFMLFKLKKDNTIRNN